LRISEFPKLLFRRSLATLERVLGPEHPNVAASLNNLAGFYRAQGNDADAASLYWRSLAIKEKALGPEHPSVATSLNNLAALYCDQGNYAEAELLFRRSRISRADLVRSDTPLSRRKTLRCQKIGRVGQTGRLRSCARIRM
jgi:tetratricopeptide (TPR) repeat protein